MREPALIFGAELPRTIDAAHAKHDSLQTEHPGVITDILVGCTLGAAIGTIEIERRRLSNALRPAFVDRLVAELLAHQTIGRHRHAVDLVGGCKDDRSRGIVTADRLPKRQRGPAGGWKNPP